MKKFLGLIITLCISVFGFSQEEVTILNMEDDSTFIDLSTLDSVENTNRLFFSGENHVFQKSNLKLELKLLKYFHKTHGVNTLLLEFGEATGWLANEYVTTGREDLREAIEVQFSENFLNYFVKIKEFNDSLSDSDKIRVVGIDLQRSFSLGFEVLNNLLPNDTVFPNDSILKEVELIKFLQGYNKNRLSSADDEGYFRGKNYSNYQSMKELIDNFYKFKTEYKSYLGDNFQVFEKIMDCSKKSYYYKSKEEEGTPMGILYREEYMYNKLNELAKNNSTDKYYGQFGRSHTLKNVSSDGYAHNFSSLVAKISKNKEGELYGKAVSIGIYYLENADDDTPVFYQDSRVENVILGALEDFPSDSIGILKVEPNSTIDSAINQNYEYIIVHNGSYAEEIYDIEELFENNNSNTVSALSVFYGAYKFDMKEVEEYLGTGITQPIQYWGIGFSVLENSFYTDYQVGVFIQEDIALADTLSLNFSGWNMMFNYGYDLLKTDKIDLIPTIGLGYQNIKMELTQENVVSGFEGINISTFEIYNPAFVLDFSGEIRVRLVKNFLALSAKYGYRLDVSDKRWKYRKGKLDVNTNMNGAFGQVSLCFGNF